MFHDRVSYYERLAHLRRQGSLSASLIYFVVSYFSGVTACFLRVGFGSWYLRTPTIWMGSFFFVGITLLVDWFVVRFLGDGTPEGFFTVVSQPFALFLFLIVAVPLVQRFVLAGRFKDREKLYSGFPIFWPVIRLFIGAIDRTRREEEYFKRMIDPALALLVALLITSDELWFVRLFFLIGGVALFARESMIRSFYETNEINVEDAMT